MVLGRAGCVERVTRRTVPLQQLSPSSPTRKGLPHDGPQGRRSDVPIVGEEQVNVSPTATAHDNDNDDTGARRQADSSKSVLSTGLRLRLRCDAVQGA